MAILFALAAATLSASAAVPPYPSFKITDAQVARVLSIEFRQCVDRSGGVTSSMRDCGTKEFARLDRALNIAYRNAMAQLNASGKAKLRYAERRWLKTRWSECDLEAASGDGGTAALLNEDGCGMSEMARRITWLQRYVSNGVPAFP